jgi:thiol-disulfide isomerase/thioredoxin
LSPVKLKVGDLAPQFSRTDLQGRPFDLRRGKIILVDFWASWCPPCIIAIPHLGQLQKKYGARGFQVVGVSMDDSATYHQTDDAGRSVSLSCGAGRCEDWAILRRRAGPAAAISDRGGRKNPGDPERRFSAHALDKEDCRRAEKDRAKLEVRRSAHVALACWGYARCPAMPIANWLEASTNLPF